MAEPKAHPDTMIGRLPCTCGHDGLEAHWHMTPCEIKVAHFAMLEKRRGK